MAERGHNPIFDELRQRPAPIPVSGATEEQVREVLRYVPALSRRYRGLGLSFDELVAAGNLGVVEAALRFDSSRNVKFISYADWWIRKAIIESLEEQAGPLRLPRYQFEKLRRLQKAREDWIRRHHEEPSVEQLSRVAELPHNDVIRLVLYLRGAVSIEEPTRSSQDRPLKELLADRSAEGPLRRLIRRDLARRLRAHVQDLETREREVLEKRFGLNGEQPKTLREVGRELDISRERVRQIELRVLLKLRDLL